jgi:hypothetical protein
MSKRRSWSGNVDRRHLLSSVLLVGGVVVLVHIALSVPIQFDDTTALDEGVVLQENFSDAEFDHGRLYGKSNGTAGNGMGFLFDGRDDYGKFDEGQLAEDALTISVRLKTSSDNAVVVSDHRGYMIYIRGSSGGAVRYIVQTERGREFVQVPPTAVQNGDWQHHALVYDGSELRAYVDGTLLARTTQRGDIVYDQGRSFVVGRRDTAGDLYYGGRVADLRVYNRALSSFAVERLHTGTTTSVPEPPVGRFLASLLLMVVVSGVAVLNRLVWRWVDER